MWILIICFSTKYKKHKALVVMCMIMIVLTMFSRNFVGVHTLSDVLVGMLIGIVSLFIIIKVEKYIEDNPNKDICPYICNFDGYWHTSLCFI